MGDQYDMFMRTVPQVMVTPNDSTLEGFGATRNTGTEQCS